MNESVYILKLFPNNTIASSNSIRKSNTKQHTQESTLCLLFSPCHSRRILACVDILESVNKGVAERVVPRHGRGDSSVDLRSSC